MLSHITKIPDQGLRDKSRNQKINHCRGNDIDVSRIKLNNEVPQNSLPPVPRIIRTAYISTTFFTDKNAQFTLKPRFQKVVLSVPGANTAKTIYTYEEVAL